MRAKKINIESLVQGYKEGKTIRQLAVRHRSSYGAIHRRLVFEGVQLRPRGQRRKFQPTIRSDDGSN